jgi:acyl transferase domain-containing protein/NAD(P)H-dependent flavin oxidoreductase YrpB (nitropropane dioxygenase family)/NADP-dependent 3-hydroxy acid dehydrogenase YdfG
LSSSFQIGVLTLPDPLDPAVAIAGSRAGALGLLDLTCVADAAEASRAISTLDRYGRGRLGLRLDASRLDPLQAIVAALPASIGTILLAPGPAGIAADQIAALRGRGATLLLETTGEEEARLGMELGVDGLVAKGHEAGGRVGDETTFILLQRLRRHGTLPVWAWGGIGLHSAAACCAAGAAGVLLDAQLALTRESPLPAGVRALIEKMDGSETTLVGAELGEPVRIYDRPGLRGAAELRREAERLQHEPRPAARQAWRRLVAERATLGADAAGRIWPLGQDAAFASSLAARFRTVGGVVQGVGRAVEEHLRAARALRPLDAGAALAVAHGTRYPIVQGPMTRVSDSAAFALEVTQGGGLPFLALALMRASEVRSLLQETRRRLGDRPWGVGILGFVPLELRQEQLAVVRDIRPGFALIAGGRPDQARALEADGIPTYLHVPSPGLLKMFLENGARRFVFEGRECGGHVGPRSSFVLWDGMVDTILETLPAAEVSGCHVLFAAGIHDALSGSMVAALAAPLAERGARVGVLLGTAYLFTREAVATGAIAPGFQAEAVRATRTVLLETGPGHATRCTDSAYAAAFEAERRRLLQEGRDAEEIRNALEALNLGRLRIASKGIDRNPRHVQDPAAPRYVTLSDAEQRRDGMFMIGQVAALRDTTCSIEELHHDIAVGGTARLAEFPEIRLPAQERRRERPLDVAIIGMSCLLPKAPDLKTYWRNILGKVDAITEVPAERWDWRRYFDAAPRSRDRIYSRWGGFLDEVPFDPMRYGMPPNTLPSIEPLQLLTLEAARAALQDAGYLERAFDRKRTSVILGAGGGVSDLGARYAFRSLLPSLVADPPADLLGRLPEWTEDSFPGILLNVAAGRVANRFDLGGLNCTIDAACASSLAAIYLAAKELETGSSDLVLAGGADTAQNPFMYLCFSQTGAHSASGRCRTFDAGADGIAISEGIAVLVLKRLADAERDGDRIYAVLKAIAASSDGRDKGLTAPRPEGQALALERAYAKAGFSPATVGLIEAHGTGTVAGDQAEVTTLRRVFEAAGAERQGCAIGSVKSMIGHTKCTAGVAGMIKVALALHHKVLPPTLNVERPNPTASFPDSPFYINSEPRPWLPAAPQQPRRAGVSAFGFGGTNFHAVVEEYTGAIPGTDRTTLAWDRPAELFLWRASSHDDLSRQLQRLEDALQGVPWPEPAALARAVWREARGRSAAAGPALAIVAASIEELRGKLRRAGERLAAGAQALDDPDGVFHAAAPLGRDGSIAFLFPGQGSQYPGMLADLALRFPEARECFAAADDALRERLPHRLGRTIFPEPAFTPEEAKAQRLALTATDVAQPALGAADMAVCHLLRRFGLHPAMTAGHSYGEYAALCAAGVFDETTLARISETRGRSILQAATQDLGTMAAVPEGPERIAAALAGLPEVWIANLNAPRQTVISGTRRGIEAAGERLRREGIEARPIPVACAFHSPLVAPARDRLAEALAGIDYAAPRCAVFSNATAAPYPSDPAAIGRLLSEHLVSPVRFADEIGAMYDAGARLFIEAGPRNVLTGLVQQILAGRDHLAVASDLPGRPGMLQLLHLLGRLAVHGAPVDLDPLFEADTTREQDVAGVLRAAGADALSPATWMVGGGQARPLRRPRQAAPAPLPLAAAPPVAPQAAPVLPGDAGAPHPAAPTARVERPIPPLPGTGAEDAAATALLSQYQQMMTRFLEIQRAVMTAYLQGTPVPPATTGTDATLPLPAPVLEIAPSLPAPAGAATPEPAPAATAPSAAAPPQAAEDAPAATAAPATGTGGPLPLLLAIVSERTGYPPDLLDLDLNIEADLGIDSIKRVEILGALQRQSPPPIQERLQSMMETITRAKTLRSILQSIDTAPAAVPDETDAATVPRFLTRLVDAPAPTDAAVRLSGTFLLTDDGGGVAPALADALRRRGANPVLLGAAAGPEGGRSDRAAVDPGDAAAVRAAVQRARAEHGPIRGIVHLASLGAPAGFEEISLAAWRDRLARDVKGLFHLAQACAADLQQAATGGGAWLMGVTGLGGDFAFDPGGARPFFPGQGGVAGLVKTLAIEWPAVRCRAIDLPAEGDPVRLAAALVEELGRDGSDVEIALGGGRRRVPRPVAAPLPIGTPARAALPPEAVVLVTGGGRGITAEVALELARRHRPTLLLVGRSPLPQDDEPPATAGIETPAELKTALIEAMRRAGRPLHPADVEAAYRAVRRDRDIRRTLGVLRETGATVRYLQADVRDESAFGALIASLYRDYGRIDGVLHGAGLIEDKLVEDKSPDSFDRVFDTKADGAFLLARLLRPESLRFFALFSSVAGRYGNRGQSDYAAANEVINKLAAALDRRWPGRVVSFNWGPWGDTGMATPEVQRQFAARGVQLVPPAAGRRAAVDEIERGAKGDVEVILGDGPWRHAPPPTTVRAAAAEDPAPAARSAAAEVRAPAAPADDLPLLRGLQVSAAGSGQAQVTRRLDPEHDLYLLDHRLDGRPVLPAAVAAELMAETVRRQWPEWEVIGLQSFRLLQGIVLEDGPRSIRIEARAETQPDPERLELAVDVSIVDPSDRRLYYRATVLVGHALPPAPPDGIPPPASPLRPFPLSVEEAYDRWLFHGPLLQGIETIEGFNEEMITARLRPAPAALAVRGAEGTAWLFDPILIDSVFQLTLLFARATTDMTPLPARIRSLRRFAPFGSGPLRCVIHGRSASGGHHLQTQTSLFDADGRLVARMEDAEFTASKALNRLAGQWERRVAR